MQRARSVFQPSFAPGAMRGVDVIRRPVSTNEHINGMFNLLAYDNINSGSYTRCQNDFLS